MPGPHDKHQQWKIFSWDNFTNTLRSFAKGTGIGLIARFGAWPLERTAYRYMDQINVLPPDRKSYFTFLFENFKPKQLLDSANIFLHSGVSQTVGKSLANMGVVNYVEENDSGLTSFQKGMKIALFCSPLEALSTAKGEFQKYVSFKGKKIKISYFSKEYANVLNSTFIRSLWSSHILYIGIYQTEDAMKSLFPSYASHPFLKPIAAFVATFAAQIPIMISIHYQNYVYEHQQLSFAKSVKGFFQQYKLTDLTYGWAARGVNRGAMNFINFAALGAWHRFFHQHHSAKQENSVPTQKPPRL